MHQEVLQDESKYSETLTRGTTGRVKAKHNGSAAVDCHQEQAMWPPAGHKEEDQVHHVNLRRPREAGQAVHNSF